MRISTSLFAFLVLGSGLSFAADAEVQTFHAYVDSDLCARLMIGPLTEKRIDCSKETYKEGSNAVLVRLKDNAVFEVNKEKMVNKLVGQLVKVTGETKEKDGKVKLQSVEPVERSAIPKGEFSSELLDARNLRVDPKTFEKVRHELAMMPYMSIFDFISFTMVGDNVILSGWTVRATNRSTAYRMVERIEEVDKIINNIEVLPLGRTDMQIRAEARARLQRYLARYFWGSGSNIRIVVKYGDIILLGTVTRQADFDVATIQCKGVTFAYHVFNRLRVVPPEGNAEKG